MKKIFIEAKPYQYEDRAGALSLKKKGSFIKVRNCAETDPRQLFLDANTPGISFGYAAHDDRTHLIGMPQGSDGNIFVVGGIGSGKSRGIAMPTLKRWSGAICATDLKGELSQRYEVLFQEKFVTRPYLVFDPTRVDGPSYDPFWWLLADDTANTISNVWEIVLAILPATSDDIQPFWVESEQALFAAALLYYFRLGLSFSEAVCQIMGTTISSLYQTLSAAEDIQIRMLLGNSADLKADVLAAIDRGLRNKLMLFASDPHISHAFRGTREGARCFTWDDLEHTNIFLRIPAEKVPQWGGAINLMLTQLLHCLERRPEQYSPEAGQIPQTLLLLDEFARFGKLDMLPAAMATLRSKQVNICLLAQSVAQIDAIYGEKERRIILDNCQYQCILRANDPETQETLCKLIGTRIQRHYAVSRNLDPSGKTITGHGIQVNEVRDWMICPHELATLNEVLLLTPHGFLRVQKFSTADSGSQSGPSTSTLSRISIHNKGATMLMIEERMKHAEKRAKAAEHQRRVAQKQVQDCRNKQVNRLKYTLGGLVLKYFPALSEIETGETQAEIQKQFQPVEAVLSVLASRPDLVRSLQEEAGIRAQAILESPDV